MWLRNGVFPDWIADDVFTLRLCEMYACRPSELAEEDYRIVMRHRVIKAAEAEFLRRDALGRATAAKVKTRGR